MITTQARPRAAQIIDLVTPLLAGQQLIVVPQAANCTDIVVVPVRGERIDRVLRLLESLALQDGHAQMEVLLVVNNREDDGTDKWREYYSRNVDVLSLPIYGDVSNNHMASTPTTRFIRERLNVFAIDICSPDTLIPGCNVGIARQRGLLEAVLRSAQRGVNTRIWHTDADCYYPDPEFRGKMAWLFDQDPTLLAMAGTYFSELVLGDPESEGLFDVIEQYKFHRRYTRLYRDITRGYCDMNFNDNIMLGSCTVHRAFEAILAGGIPSVHVCEDVEFSDRLKAYAAANGLRVDHGRKWGLGPVTAFRISDRTGANIEHRFGFLNPHGPTMVDDAFNPGTQVPLTAEYMQRLIDAVRAMPNGPERIEYLFIMSPLCHFRIRRN